jgi:adenylosuccinate lyase
MIPRYSRKEAVQIFSDEERLELWKTIELKVVEVRVRRGEFPPESLEALHSAKNFTWEEVLEEEKKTRHDLLAFVEVFGRKAGRYAQYLHRGLTSSDILDTAFSLQLLKGTNLLLKDLKECTDLLKEMALKYRHTVMVGRTHGVHAEPITLGLKFLRWYALLKRREAFLRRASETIRYGKLSGAVGSYSHLSPEVEEEVLSELGLLPERPASQVVQRDRYAEYYCALALLASAIESIAIEIRSLARTEIREWEEPFREGQKGSSAMPHKRNPVLSENLTGLARLVRGYLIPVLESISLWDERDISHSSVERVAFPDGIIALDFALHRLKEILQDLVIYPEKMQENLSLTRGLIFSQKVLVTLMEKVVPRTEAYEIVQKKAMEVWEGKGDLFTLLWNDPECRRYLSYEELKECFSIDSLLKEVDKIFSYLLKGEMETT